MALFPLLCLSLATAQEAPLIHTAFESSEGGWMAVQPAGTGAEVSVVHEPPLLKVGPGSLKLRYAVAQGQVAAAALPFADGAVAKMASMHFWVRPDQNAPLVVTLEEKGGGRYTAMFSAVKDRWQEVSLGVHDFVLGTGEGDPKDPDGKLDPEQVGSVSILDLDQMLAQNTVTAGLLGVSNGPRTLYLSDFQISAKPLPDASAETIDDFARPQPGWAALDAAATVVSEAPLNARALRLDYDLPLGKAAGAFKPIQPGALAGKSVLSLRLASKNARQIILQLEAKGGGKYNFPLSVPAGSEAVERTISMAEMKAADDSKDADGKLDPDQIRQISIIDVTAVSDVAGPNTLWIGKVAAKA